MEPQNKLFNTLIKALPFAFLLHNVEEALTIGNSTLNISIFSFPTDALQFSVAVTLFTLLGFMVVYARKLYPNETFYSFAITGFVSMLLLNAFFPHIFAGLFLMRYVPGVITAAFLIVPVTGYLLIQIYRTKYIARDKLLLTIIIGAVIGVVLLGVFQSIGYVVSTYLG